MSLPLDQLARLCGAEVLGGEPARRVRSAASLETAAPDQVAPLTDARFDRFLAQTRAAGVFVRAGVPCPPPPPGTALLRAADPELAFIEALRALYPQEPERPEVDPRACVEAGAELGAEVHVGPFAVVRTRARVGAGSWILAGAYVGRGCQLGARCRLYPGAVLYDGVILGEGVIVHAGAVLGADGFGYKFREGRHVKVPQVGGVRVGDDAEIGANTCVDRAALGETSVGAGSKLDNLVQVGHNTQLGKHVILCGQVGLSGSVQVEDYAVLGGNAGVADHVTIGRGARVGGKAGVIRNIPPGTEVWGLPAEERHAFWQQIAALRRLPELLERLRKLEQEVARLREKPEA